MDEGESGWGSEWDKKGTSSGIGPDAGGSLLPTKEGGMIVNTVPAAVEEVPTSCSHCWWLIMVWIVTS